MQPRLKDYFHFNKSERRGTISLFILIICIIVGNELLIYLNPDPPSIGLNLDSLKNAIEQKQSLQKEFAEAEKKNITIELVEFDPNGLSLLEWMSLGLSEKQAASILKYEEKGGSFKTKSDVRKMYTISDEVYVKLEPFILLPDSIDKNQKNDDYSKSKKKWENTNWDSKKKDYPKVLINSAETADLKKLYGIGDYYALKIVEYRTNLGGFVSKKQLKEVWGLKQETLIKLDTQLILDQVSIRKLNINRASADELKQHPYIYWKVANSIVKYREQHGSYSNIEEIKQSELVSDSLYEKLKPYLKK